MEIKEGHRFPSNNIGLNEWRNMFSNIYISMFEINFSTAYTVSKFKRMAKKVFMLIEI